jgi:hypothetical protein
MHGRSADVEQARYRGFVEVLTGQEIERDDLFLDLLVGLGDERVGLGRLLR